MFKINKILMAICVLGMVLGVSTSHDVSAKTVFQSHMQGCDSKQHGSTESDQAYLELLNMYREELLNVTLRCASLMEVVFDIDFPPLDDFLPDEMRIHAMHVISSVALLGMPSTMTMDDSLAMGNPLPTTVEVMLL